MTSTPEPLPAQVVATVRTRWGLVVMRREHLELLEAVARVFPDAKVTNMYERRVAK